MSHITYSPNTSESDLNELSFSLFDSNDEEENNTYEEMGISSRERKVDVMNNNLQILVNNKPINISSSGCLYTTTSSMSSLYSSASNLLPTQCIGEQSSWSINSQRNEQFDNKNKKSVGKNDRRMAKQLTERKRRDRINALLNNLRTLILKLLHKNPRHHRKLEKADILELVVSFLKKELNQTRGKASSSLNPTPSGGGSSSISQQQNHNNSLPILLKQQTKYYQPSSLNNCPQNSLDHSELFPLLNQPNNCYFVRNNHNNGNIMNDTVTKTPYPSSMDSIHLYPHLYTTIYPYNLSSGEPPCQSITSSHYPPTPLNSNNNYQPVLLLSTSEDSSDDINKENQISMNKNHNYFKNINYYHPSCYNNNSNNNDTKLDQCSIRQPLDTLNINNNNIKNNNNGCYYSNNQTCSSSPALRIKQSPQPIMMTMMKLYPDILNNHLLAKEEQATTIIQDDENCQKCCYISSTLNDENQFSQHFVRNNGDNSHIYNSNYPTITVNNRRMHSSSDGGESTNHSTTLWRPYV